MYRTPKPQNSVSELATKYALQNSIRDVWVEGPSDQRFLAWYFAEHDVGVRDVGDIDIDQTAIDWLRLGLRSHSRRDALIAFAVMLDRELAFALRDLNRVSAPGRYACVVDRDRIDLQTEYCVPHLYYTDYRDFEMYLAVEPCMSKFLLVGCGCAKLKSSDVDNVMPIARRITAVHDVQDAFGWGIPKVEIDGYLNWDSARHILEWDEVGYVQAYLNRGGRRRQEGEFMLAVEARMALPGDVRLHVRGHTFLEVLAFCLRRVLGVGREKAVTMCNSAWLSLERAWIREIALFHRLELALGV